MQFTGINHLKEDTEMYAGSVNSFPSLAASLIGLAVSIVCIVAECMIFRKAGIHPAKLFIPIYGGDLFYSIADSGALYIVSCIISGAASLITSLFSRSYSGVETNVLLLVLIGIALAISLVIHIVFLVRLARTFRKSTGFALGLIFLFPIFLCILGFEREDSTSSCA